MVTEADVYALEQRIRKLEEKIEHMAGVGDVVEVKKPHLCGDTYETKKFVIQRIVKKQKVKDSNERGV